MATQPKTVKSTPKTKPASKPASKQAPASNTRRETDSMGEMLVPSDALYGATTQRAVLNFPVSFRPVPQAQIEAHVLLKKCCAEANAELGELPKSTALLIVTACDEILRDFAVAAPRSMPHPLMSHFPIDVFQTGSGTSTNMNVNEVVANVASRRAGKAIGSKDPIHPNDHVNYGQSSNDTFPSSMQIAGALRISQRLVPALERLTKVLDAKAKEWDSIVKIGRTHLMDATPIRLGQEFSGYAAAARLSIARARSGCRPCQQHANRRHGGGYRHQHACEVRSHGVRETHQGDWREVCRSGQSFRSAINARLRRRSARASQDHRGQPHKDRQ